MNNIWRTPAARGGSSADAISLVRRQGFACYFDSPPAVFGVTLARTRRAAPAWRRSLDSPASLVAPPGAAQPQPPRAVVSPQANCLSTEAAGVAASPGGATPCPLGLRDAALGPPLTAGGGSADEPQTRGSAGPTPERLRHEHLWHVQSSLFVVNTVARAMNHEHRTV